MKKKLLFPCMLLSLVMLFTCVCAFGVGAAEEMTMTDVDAGTKTPVAGDVVTISTEAELNAFSAYVSAGKLTEGVTFRLDADIALTAKGTTRKPLNNFNPIGGMYGGTTEIVPFKGTFDGNGKTVSNLQFNNQQTSQKTFSDAVTASVGLFVKLDGATVKNLTVKVAKLESVGANGAVGVIAGEAVNTTIVGCTVEAHNNAATQAYIKDLKTGCVFGGVVGKATGSVIDGCTSSLWVNGNSTTAGVVGIATDTVIRNSVVSGKYQHSAVSALGGVAGMLEGTSCVENCYSSATLTSAIANDLVGGVAAAVAENATVENCFSAAILSTDKATVSGVLVGENNGTVHHSFALREEADTNSLLNAHYDIRTNNGTATEIYAYQPKTEGDATVFVIGSVVRTENDPLNCHELAGSACVEGTPSATCTVCGGDGIAEKVTYRFVPSTNTEIGSLVDALNDWVNEKAASGVDYANWTVSGNTITNCLHNGSVTYKNITQKPTCSAEGVGDKYCTCGVLLEAGAAIPVDPTAHESEDGKTYICKDYVCKHCNETIVATSSHRVGNKHCVEQMCEVCGTPVAASQPHTKPLDFDYAKPCADYKCTVCQNTVRDDVDHTADPVEHACQDSVCSLCGYVIQKGTAHRPGRAANCVKAQTCLDCGVELRPARGHTPGALETCGTPQTCKNCAYIFTPATGEHVWNLEHSNCTTDKQCKVCGSIDERRTGHSPDAATSVDCGHGKVCSKCHVVLNPAAGDHNVNWAAATVVRAATAERTGIVVGICTTCGREVEAYTTCVAMEEAGNALVTGGSLTFYAGTHVNATFGKVADYKNVAYADGYLPLQVVTLSVVGASGEDISVSSGVTVKVVLNKSAAKMANGTLKLYQVANGQATEIAISSMADGFITFSASSMGTFVLVGEKTAAFTVLGTLPVQAQQTAALIGTASYERRDFDI